MLSFTDGVTVGFLLGVSVTGLGVIMFMLIRLVKEYRRKEWEK